MHTVATGSIGSIGFLLSFSDWLLLVFSLIVVHALFTFNFIFIICGSACTFNFNVH